jgi:hypothetical protein
MIVVFLQCTLKEKLPIFLINTLLLHIPLLDLTDGWNHRRRNELILVGLGNLMVPPGLTHQLPWSLSQIRQRGIVLLSNTSSGAFGGWRDEGSDVTVWNFPIEISFQLISLHGWPQLFVSDYSLNFMGHDVVHRYASLLLPIRPGGHTKYMKTYHPVNSMWTPWFSFPHEKQRVFIFQTDQKFLRSVKEYT